MCGINGIYHFSRSAANTRVIARMNDVLAHRGPDAEGIYNDEKIHLGHRRLSIIDVSEAANQPLFYIDNNYVIFFNGEVYN